MRKKAENARSAENFFFRTLPYILKQCGKKFYATLFEIKREKIFKACANVTFAHASFVFVCEMRRRCILFAAFIFSRKFLERFA